MDTYATLVFLLPFGLLAETWSYRGVIFLGLLFRELTRVLLVYGEGVGAMQLMQTSYAAGYCVEAVYFAFPYQVCSRERSHCLR